MTSATSFGYSALVKNIFYGISMHPDADRRRQRHSGKKPCITKPAETNAESLHIIDRIINVSEVSTAKVLSAEARWRCSRRDRK